MIQGNHPGFLRKIFDIADENEEKLSMCEN